MAVILRVLLLPLVVIGAACSCRPRYAATGVAALEAPYSEQASLAGAAPRHTPADDAAQALGLPALSRALLPEGARELRVSDWYPMIAGTPVPVLRLVEQRARPAVGQWIWVWTERREWPRRYRAARCSQWADAARTCASGTTGPPLDWQAVASQFERLGAWTVREKCEADGVHVTDSGALMIQRLAGVEFDTYECNSPSRRTGSAAGRTALAIYQYFGTLARQAGGPPPA